MVYGVVQIPEIIAMVSAGAIVRLKGGSVMRGPADACPEYSCQVGSTTCLATYWHRWNPVIVTDAMTAPSSCLMPDLMECTCIHFGVNLD